MAPLHLLVVEHLHAHCLAEVAACEYSVAAQFLLDTQDLVELCQSLASSGGTGLDLACTEPHHDISNGDIFCLAGTVRDHDAPTSGERILRCLDRFGEGTNLVDLQEQSVTSLGLNGTLNADRVGDCQVVADKISSYDQG
jgi:hypothetical protein